MKTSKKQPVVLMTSKKGTKKGTRKVFMLDLRNMEVIDKTDNVTAILYDKEFPEGISGTLKGGIMVINPARVLVDPVHVIKEITLDELNAIQAADYVDGLGEVKNKVDVNEMLKQAFNGRSITEVEATMEDKSPEEVKAFLTQSFKAIGVDVDVTYVGETKKEPKEEAPKQAPKTATAKMDEVSALFRSGKMTHEKFRELFPEGSMLEFAKQLSEETGDASFYNLAKVLEALRPKARL